MTSMKLYERPKGPIRSRANSISSVASSGVLQSQPGTRRNSNAAEVKQRPPSASKTSNPSSRRSSLIPTPVNQITNEEENERFINQAAAIDDKFRLGMGASIKYMKN